MKTPAPRSKPIGVLRLVIVATLSAITTVSEALPLTLSDTPLVVNTGAEPNVLLTFDDSGSMGWAFLPDTLDQGNATPNDGGNGLFDQPRGCASNINKIYYNPNNTYNPPVQSDGVTELNNGVAPGGAKASFAAAYINGFNPSLGTINLGATSPSTYRPSWDGLTIYGNCGLAMPTSPFYYVYDPAATGCAAPSVDRDACYRLVQHGNAAAGGNWSAAQQLNFANWYSYYRTRNLMAKSAVGFAFGRFGTNVRVAAQHLNSVGGATGNWRDKPALATVNRFPNYFGAGATPNHLQQFTGDYRYNFFAHLYNSPAQDITPLREAMFRAGEYLRTVNPYLDTPANAFNATSNPDRSCRQNFHVLMTDGYWNGTCSNGSTPGAGGCGTFVGGNVDNTNTALPAADASVVTQLPINITSYTAMPPYRDGNTASLADAAFFYWVTDLRGTGAVGGSGALINNVPPHINDKTGTATQQFWNPKNDPATWQHMVTYTIGLGLDGNLVDDTPTYNALVAGTTQWSPIYNPPAANAAAANRGKIDDLWHTAINGHGQYFSASDPSTLVNAFSTIVNAIIARTAAASSVSVSGQSLATSKYIYQANFESGSWSGHLYAKSIDPVTGNLLEVWDGAKTLAQQHYDSGRQILSYQPSGTGGVGIRFRWPVLDATQKANLDRNSLTGFNDGQGEARLNWIRGDASNEGGSGFEYRARTRMCGLAPCAAGTPTGWLGDTVDSSPIYVGSPPYNYPSSLESVAYQGFKTSMSGRRKAVYIGANDGMLHAFDADTGYEYFAYVPGATFPNLSVLPNGNYTHRFYVDGGLESVDAFYRDKSGTQGWHTVLAGTLRNGGQGVFALDVTQPDVVNEANASDKVLWEFTDKNDSDLGYAYGKPSIARTHTTDHDWAVFIGNGYNNSETSNSNGIPDTNNSTTGYGAVYVLFIEKGVGGWANGTSYIKLLAPEGTTGTPNGLTAPAVVDIDGDYNADYIYAGDLRGNIWRWDIRNPDPTTWSSTRVKVFATGSTSFPITTRPVVGAHPAGKGGVMVYFGTGKYLEPVDNTTAIPTQTFYGVWDTLGGATVFRANLLDQQIITTQSAAGGTFRGTTNKPIDWTSRLGWYLDLTDPGERVIADPILRGGDVIFTTFSPSQDPCEFGGSGWLMELSAENGGPPVNNVFDTNADGSISAGDTLVWSSGGGTSGLKFTGGAPSMPAILTGDGGASGAGKLCQGQDVEVVQTSSGTPKVNCRDSQGCINCRNSWRQRR